MTKTFLAKGKRGHVYVYKSKVDGKDVCVKEKNPDAEAMGIIENEARFLKIANEHGIGPKILNQDENKVVMEFVQGERILDFIERSPKTGIAKVIRDSLDQARTLDEIGVNKFEMTNPYKHIIVNNKKPIMIDFERCRKTNKPKNVNQFIQFITSTKVKHLLDDKNLNLDAPELRELAKKYKEKYDEKLFLQIKNSIK